MAGSNGGNGRGSHLYPPGVSGNPAGSSRKQRRRRLLRDALSELMQLQVPPNMLQERVLGLLPPGMTEPETLGHAMALRLIYLSMKSEDDNVAIRATHEILASEPKHITIDPADPDANDDTAPPDDPDRLKQVVAILAESDVLH